MDKEQKVLNIKEYNLLINQFIYNCPFLYAHLSTAVSYYTIMANCHFVILDLYPLYMYYVYEPNVSWH